MPIYEFTCTDCTARFEQLVLRADEPIACPACHSTRTEKQPSACCVRTGTAGSGACSGCSGGNCATCHN